KPLGHAGEGRGGRRHQARIEVAPEGEAAADEVFPEAGLRFMHAWRRTSPQRSPVDVLAHAMVVHGVSRLMDRSEQTLVEEIAGHARCDAHVAGAERGRERMRGEVLATTLEVVAQP